MSLQIAARARRGEFALDATLDARDGETIALLGPNGAGKSTLVDLLAGLIRAESGRVVLGDEVLDDVAAAVHVPPSQRSIGVGFQGGRLLPHLSVLENVAFPLRARGMRAAPARDRARETLELAGASELAAARPSRLSGGETQRVALARALVAEPRLLLLDEPLSALDASSRPRLRALLRQILSGFRGVAIVVTHDPVDAMTLAQRLVLLEDGRVTQTGSPEEIRGAPGTPYAAELVGVNLFSGTLEPPSEGLAVLHAGDGDVICAAPVGVEDRVEGALGILRPADVSLFLDRPEGSARNVFAGEVIFVSVEGDRARVGIGSSPPLVAEVTAASLRRLGVAEGSRVWASFKALEVRVVLP